MPVGELAHTPGMVNAAGAEGVRAAVEGRLERYGGLRDRRWLRQPDLEARAYAALVGAAGAAAEAGMGSVVAGPVEEVLAARRGLTARRRVEQALAAALSAFDGPPDAPPPAPDGPRALARLKDIVPPLLARVAHISGGGKRRRYAVLANEFIAGYLGVVESLGHGGMAEEIVRGEVERFRRRMHQERRYELVRRLMGGP